MSWSGTRWWFHVFVFHPYLGDDPDGLKLPTSIRWLSHDLQVLNEHRVKDAEASDICTRDWHHGAIFPHWVILLRIESDWLTLATLFSNWIVVVLICFLVTVPFSGPLWGIREINITDKSENTLRFFATTSHAWSGSKLCIRNMEHDSLAYQLQDVLNHICHQIHWNAKLPTMSFDININSTSSTYPRTNANHLWILDVFVQQFKPFIAPTIASLSSHVGFEVWTLLRWGSTRLLEFIRCWDAQVSWPGHPGLGSLDVLPIGEPLRQENAPKLLTMQWLEH